MNSKPQTGQYFPYSNPAARPQQQQSLHHSLLAPSGGGMNSSIPHLDINLLKALGLHNDFNNMQQQQQQQQPQRTLQSQGNNGDGSSPHRDHQVKIKEHLYLLLNFIGI